jgi:hypothetical protein
MKDGLSPTQTNPIGVVFYPTQTVVLKFRDIQNGLLEWLVRRVERIKHTK